MPKFEDLQKIFSSSPEDHTENCLAADRFDRNTTEDDEDCDGGIFID